MRTDIERQLRHNVVFMYDYMTISVTIDRPESDSTDEVILAAWAILHDEYGIDNEPNDTDVDSWGIE